MRLDTSQQMKTDMRMRLAPRMIQSMEILQLPLLALQERIDQELSENPVLVDLRESPQTEGDEDLNGLPDNRETEPVEVDPDLKPDADVDDDWMERFHESHRPSRAGLGEEADHKHDAMQNMASRPRSIHDDLSAQLGFLNIDPQTRALADYVIHNLDHNGYLNIDLDEVARDFGGEVGREQAETALALVQQLDPAGVGARNLRECLLLQLTPETPHRDVVQALIEHHLEDIEQNRLPAIEKKTGYPLDVIKQAIHQLRRLDPRPGSRFAPESIPYVLPDLIVERDEDGEYHVRLADENSPRLSISRYYQKQLKNKQTAADAREFIQKRMQSARWLIESIEQRRGTLLKVAQAIIDHQRAFLDLGADAIEPLKMQQIADRVHVHVTTVSRAVDDKWIETPRGVFPLKRFFGGGTTTADGDAVAWDTIKNKLQEIIAKEDKQHPLSDEEISDALAACGFNVARRTVTKYREALRIPSSRQRKAY